MYQMEVVIQPHNLLVPDAWLTVCISIMISYIIAVMCYYNVRKDREEELHVRFN